MAIPNTEGGWSLDDVRLEVGEALTASLQDCFTSSHPSGFNATYEGSKDRLSNFRDYDHGAVTAIFATRDETVNSTNCSINATTARWHDGAGALPTVGDTIYTDSGGTTVLVGGFDYWIGLSTTSGGSSGITVLVNGVGEVGVVYTC